jgi:MoaA/NifB/PqqE/SkfB family radical SAM enzyme
VLRFARIVLDESTTNRCVRCHPVEAEVPRDTHAVLDEIRETAGSWSGGPGPNLSFVGGEPLGHPALPEFLEAALAASVCRLQLESDARALRSAATAENVLRAGVRHLSFPLLGPTADAHDTLSGESGSFEHTIAGVRSFQDVASAHDMRINLVARVSVCRHNLPLAPEIVAIAAKTGADVVVLSIDDANLDLRRAVPWIEAACDTGVVNTTWVEVRGVPYCFAGGWELHLACVYDKVDGEKSSACGECPLDDVCGGAVRGASRNVVGALSPPHDAAQMARSVLRGFAPPEMDG